MNFSYVEKTCSLLLSMISLKYLSDIWQLWFPIWNVNGICLILWKSIIIHMQTYKNLICNYCNHLISKIFHIQYYSASINRENLQRLKKKLFLLSICWLKLHVHNIANRWGKPFGWIFRLPTEPLFVWWKAHRYRTCYPSRCLWLDEANLTPAGILHRRACPIRLFDLPVWPRECSKSSGASLPCGFRTSPAGDSGGKIAWHTGPGVGYNFRLISNNVEKLLLTIVRKSKK